MYIPKMFKQESREEQILLMQAHPFASLVTQTTSGIEINHLPMLAEEIDDKLFIKGHIARGNRLWKMVSQGAEAKVIFQGPHCYISPNHYPSKVTDHKVVPTWNYVAVHATGIIRFVMEPAWLLNLVDELTQSQEADYERPWSIYDAPQNYIEKMLTAIVGIEIEVTHLEGKWKLSQNQTEQNRTGVIQGLTNCGDDMSVSVSQMMRDLED